MLKRITEFTNCILIKNASFKDIVVALFTGAIAGFISLWVFRDISLQIFSHAIPLGGDGSLTSFYLSLVERNSYWHVLTGHISSTNYGWPSHLDFSNYPIGQIFEMLMLKLAVSCFGFINPAVIIHVVAILKAIPISLATYVFARTIGISKLLASIAGIAYSITNFNLIRSEGHFFLALTWCLPLALAALYIGYRDLLKKHSPGNDKFPDRTLSKVIALSVLSSFSSYYFTIFIILAYIFVILLSLPKDLFDESSTYKVMKTRAFWLRLVRVRKALLTGFSISIIGLLVQTIPILIRTASSPHLTSIADRSWTEPIVYGGTLESYFFDLSNLVSRFLSHPEAPPYLQTRTSWEATQSGSTAGLVGYLLLGVLIFTVLGAFSKGRVHPTKFANRIEASVLFLLSIYLFFFTLYIVSPVNFAISRVLPEIRAWGRLSTVLGLLSILLICYIGSRTERRYIGYLLVLLVVVLPTLGDAKLFHDSRPTGVQMNSQYLAEQQNLSATWSKLERTFKQGCALVNLPVYPFPEFDNPLDSNGDYAELNLVSYKQNYFKWSYPGVKDTEQFADFQNLASQEPNFSRVGLSYQMEFAQSLSACGVVLDRTLLVPNETEAFASFLQDSPDCFISLPGEQFSGFSRFFAVNFKSSNCENISMNYPKKADLQSTNSSFLWKIDQPYSLNFSGGYEMFPPSSSISFRIAKLKTQTKENGVVAIRFISNSPTVIPPGIKVCLSGEGRKFPICGETNSASGSNLELQIPDLEITKPYLKLTANLVAPNLAGISSWGLIVK
jgi:hypothetical protein